MNPQVRVGICQFVSLGVTMRVGDTIAVQGVATDSDNNLINHLVEIQNPDGVWSSQGWLQTPEWSGGINGSPAKSIKTAHYVFDRPGIWKVRSSAIDKTGLANSSWQRSDELVVSVLPSTKQPSPTPPPTTPVATTPPPTPPPTTPVATTPPPTSFVTTPPPTTPTVVTVNIDWNSRFGPTWNDLNPDSIDARPTLYLTPDIAAVAKMPDGSPQTFIRCNPYNVGSETGFLSDYYSCAGQVIYVPNPGAMSSYNDGGHIIPIPNPGIDRIQTIAHYNGTFATSPRIDPVGTNSPEPAAIYEPRYKDAKQPIAIARTVPTLTNEALTLWSNGYISTSILQTSRDDGSWPLPVEKLPDTKIPTGGLATSTSNEFAFITVKDAITGVGQLAVVALEGKWLAFHTWPWMGLCNHGSWSDFKILGYIDLPIFSPDHVAVASNGYWDSPGSTNNVSLGQMDWDDPNFRNGLLNGTEPGWTGIIARGGYAMVSSKTENRVVFIDLTNLFTFFANSWVNDYTNTKANRGPGPTQFPPTFDNIPEAVPVVLPQVFNINTPVSLLAGQRIDRWSQDNYKAYVASEDGTIHIFDTSSLIARWDWETKNPLAEIGNFQVGRNPISMCHARFAESGLPLIPQGSAPDPTNNFFFIACRGDRRIDQVVTFQAQGQLVRSIEDIRMDDPVHVSVADRAYILTVVDYSGQKILSFRLGVLNSMDGRSYGAGPNGTDMIELCGWLNVPGNPIMANSANVN